MFDLISVVTLQDALLGNQTASGMRAILAPKLNGACGLAMAGRHMPLTASIAFSSIAGLTGSSGQANYAAATAALDASQRMMHITVSLMPAIYKLAPAHKRLFHGVAMQKG